MHTATPEMLALEAAACSAAHAGGHRCCCNCVSAAQLDPYLIAERYTNASDCIFAVYTGSEPLDRCVDPVLSNAFYAYKPLAHFR